VIKPLDLFTPDRFALDLYAAVLEGRSLARAIEPLARALGTSTHAVHLMQYESGVLREARCAGGGLAADVTAEYEQFWVHHDPWARAAATSGEGVLNLTSRVSARQMRQAAIWNEWKAPRDGAFHCLSALVKAPDGMAGRIAFHRPVRAEAFGRAEAALLEPIFPHLRRALVAEARLTADGWRSARALRAGFATLRQGVVLLDRQRRIVATNPAVEAMAAQGDGLSLVPDGGLSSQDAEARQALARAVGSAIAAIAGSVRMMPDAAGVALPRRSKGPPWLVQALPLRRLEAPGLPEGFSGVMLLVTDESTRLRPRAPLLRQAFGLTPAEASLAAALAAGKTLAQHAASRRIAVETVRGQLLAVRRKTGTRSLAGLTGLLGRLTG
jgi:DNA-binding CsgD family transcriptional regulator/PAS domain-containing protein